ncbi:D-alanyl-D-alanine carboxypeptidase [Parvularcula sp. IMCC14364]|uniref:D-alanyl-D-alanine carboxypeptidase n=1 Tax=Parvularcula sp. IMCC14364 TaxID=3067902 RepID=UPI0027413437|nr:D-alanyl-D-alanine carboxypeptidase [Parvularcula sp. IMCC14364]
MLAPRFFNFLPALLASLALTLIGAAQPALANSKYAALVIHADTGDILFDKYSTQRRYPASLTKIMTLYLLFEELEKGNLTLESKLTASHYAASMPASDLGLKRGQTIKVEDAINALVIKSANDVAVVVAEKIAGSEKAFATKMTNKAWSMGMRSTQFRNASGLPNSKQYTTARDMAVLARRMMQDFPQYWHYFQKENLSWKGNTYNTHNKLVGSFDGANGLKTGYTRMSGYNLATTITRGDNRLIGIVLGGRSGTTRNRHMREILDKAYKDIAAKPYLVSAVYRAKPRPNMKPTTLATLGGVWPPADYQLVSANDIGNAPTVNGSTAMQYELANRAAELGLTDDMGILITENMTETERLNAMSLAQAYEEGPYAQGDADANLPTADLIWSIQTGAYSTQDRANTELAEIQQAFTTLLIGASPVISEIISDGKSIYRVRFNYMTENQSSLVCSAIIADGGGCFVMRETDASGN